MFRDEVLYDEARGIIKQQLTLRTGCQIMFFSSVKPLRKFSGKKLKIRKYQVGI